MALFKDKQLVEFVLTLFPELSRAEQDFFRSRPDLLGPAVLEALRNEASSGMTPLPAKMADLKLVDLFELKDQYFTGHELLKRAVALPNRAGKAHAEWFLEHLDDNILQNWKDNVLVFSQYLKSKGAEQYVYCIYWNYRLGRWMGRFELLGHNFNRRYRVVCLADQTSASR